MNGWNSTLQAAWYIRCVRIIWFLWTKPTMWLLILSFIQNIARVCSMFYLYEGYRSVTPLDAAGSTGRFSKTINSCIKLRTTRQLPIFNLFSTATEESSFFHLPLTCSSSAPIVLLFVVVLRLLFERSEFLIATSKKKKNWASVWMCVWMFAFVLVLVWKNLSWF